MVFAGSLGSKGAQIDIPDKLFSFHLFYHCLAGDWCFFIKSKRLAAM